MHDVNGIWATHFFTAVVRYLGILDSNLEFNIVNYWLMFTLRLYFIGSTGELPTDLVPANIGINTCDNNTLKFTDHLGNELVILHSAIWLFSANLHIYLTTLFLPRSRIFEVTLLKNNDVSIVVSAKRINNALSQFYLVVYLRCSVMSHTRFCLFYGIVEMCSCKIAIRIFLMH